MSERRIVVFDVETTGTDKKIDQVIELCVQFGVAADAPSRTWRIKPEAEMSPGAQDVHGISPEDLANCPSFADVSDEIREIFEEAQVLVGYNLSFDIDMVQAEFARLKQPLIEFGKKHIVDPFRLWQMCEPRSLQDAHKRFVGSEFEAAHSASADVAATGRVLCSMVSAFGLAPSWAGVAEVCEPDRGRWVGPSRHIQWSDKERIVLAFGKHRDLPVAELASNSDLRGYAEWIADRDFPPHVGEVIRKALEVDETQLVRWAMDVFGRPKRGQAPAQGRAQPSPAQPSPAQGAPPVHGARAEIVGDSRKSDPSMASNGLGGAHAVAQP